MRSIEFARIGAVSALVLVSLSGCSTWRGISSWVSGDNAQVCPDAAILANTAMLPAFDPAKGDDPSNITYTVSMYDVKTRCSFAKRQNTVDGDVHVFFTATRPPGGEEISYKVPYYLAITTGGDIVDKQIHWLQFEFRRSATEAKMDEWVSDIHLDVPKQRKSYEYHFLVGFQLTQAQLDYLKKMGQYAP